MQLRKSERKQAKIKLALQGSAGSGKTYSSLLLAKGLTNGDFSKVAIIDTENRSADLYAHLGDYNVLTLTPPFTTEKYVEGIEICEKANVEVIIIDSFSHCWEYLLDFHSKMAGNSFTNWAKIKPLEKVFLNKILQSSAHIIATMRTKQDYVLNQKDGKFIPEKVGLKSISRDGTDYEFTLVFDLDIKHFATSSKDRTGLFMDKTEFIINASTGKKIREWCENGTGTEQEILATIAKEIIACTTVEGLRHIYSKYPAYQTKIKDTILLRKAAIENANSQIIPNSQIINQESKNQENGIDNSK